MRLFRVSALLVLAGAVAAGALLFWTSQSVQQAEDRLHDLQKGIRNEERAIRVLSAEWAYLNNPARLEGLAADVLNLTSSNAAFRVLDERQELPGPFIPALPPRKPLLKAQPVSFGEQEGAP